LEALFNKIKEPLMLDMLFTIGQAAATLLLVYGAFLTLMPARRAAPERRREDEMLLLRHSRSDV
jgi:hypothetical protein